MYKSLLIFIVIPYYCLAQDPNSINYSLDEGLPTSNIYSVFEDYNGYMWFATDVGVLQYDGYTFKHYNTDDGLGDNEVFKFYEDSKKRLWFLTLNGEISYYKDHNFFNSRNSPFLKSVSHQKMLKDVFEDEKGFLHFLYSDGKIVTLDITLTNSNFKQLNVVSHSIWKDNEGFNALTRVSIRNINTQDEVFFENNIMSLNSYRYYHDTSNYYFSIKDCIYEFVNKKVIKIAQLHNSEINFITKIDNVLWTGTRNGLYILKGKTPISYYSENSISSIIKDIEGNIWVTTLDDGIKFIPSMKVMQTNFNHKKLKINSIVKDDDNALWVGSENGLYKLNSDKSFESISISNDNQYIKRIRNYNNSIHVIGDNSIDIFNNKKKEIFLFSANDILRLSNEYIIASSVVLKFNSSEAYKINNDFKISSPRILGKYKIFSKRTNVSVKGFDNSVLFGTSTGLFKHSNNTINKVESQKAELNTSILDLNVDNKSNRLLVASNSKGIISLKNNKYESHLTTLDGLNSNSCNTIEKVDNDTYFIGTNKGLNKIKFIKDSPSITNYNWLLKNRNQRIYDIEIIDSLVYLATDKGLLSFKSNVKPEKKISSRLVIENLLINGKEKKEITNLSYDDNDITIHFTGISYSDFGNIAYEYKFSDDDNWLTTTNRQLNFKDLSPATYKLNIRSRGSENLYSDTAEIVFTIKPPIWRTVPFIISLITLLFCATVFIIKIRIKKLQSRFARERKMLKNEQEKMTLEKQMVELEQKALRLQMNPHFIFNALNTIKGYYSGGNIKEANHYISKFSKLLRLILENDTHLISLSKEIEMLELYIKLIKLRYQNVFHYNISISESISIEDIGVPPLLFQPMIENAIIHGLAPKNEIGNLDINFTIKDQKLICKIIDNGIGFKANYNKNHKSKAIAITKERIMFLNNSKSEDNFQIINLKDPTGTKIIIKLPLQDLWN